MPVNFIIISWILTNRIFFDWRKRHDHCLEVSAIWQVKIWWWSPLALCVCLSHHNHHEVSGISSWLCLSIPISSVQFISVAQSCPTLCDPMNRSTPGLPVHHQLPELTQTHPLSQWCHPAISSSIVPFSSCPQSLPASESCPISQLFAWGGQNTGVSALASFLPKNTQDWSPLDWTGWISLQSKGLSRVFSNTTVQKHQFFGAQPSSQSNSHIHTWLLEKP